jgi:ABC-type uncharacterized transport system substrate-binding protein
MTNYKIRNRSFKFKSLWYTIFVIFITIFFIYGYSFASDQRKVLYINSYHWGYQWSDSITGSICNNLNKKLNSRGEVIDDSNSHIALKIIYMDTKRNTSKEFLEKSAKKIKKIIDTWQPDIVITSDDNAAKYIIVPYFKNAHIPFVFCGINWDASEYGFPCDNVTGIIEVQLIDQIISQMSPFARGGKIAFLKGDDTSARKEATSVEKYFNISLDKHFVKTFSQWKEQYILLQKESDMILMGNTISIHGWDEEKAKSIIADYTQIPTGNWDSWMAPYALITFATKPEEHGEWAATTALKILSGISPLDIPMVTNKKARVILNMPLAKKLGIKFPMELINRATFTGY